MARVVSLGIILPLFACVLLVIQSSFATPESDGAAKSTVETTTSPSSESLERAEGRYLGYGGYGKKSEGNP